MVALFAAVACGGTPPPAPVSATKKPAPTPEVQLPGVRGELLQALRALPKAEPVIEGLSDQSKKELNAFVAAIGEKDQAELRSPQGARVRPLLHLAVGGSSEDALYEMITTRRLADEVVQLRFASGGKERGDLVDGTREGARRAGLLWLRARATEVASPALKAELCERIDRVARSLQLKDVLRLARETAVELSPTPERWLAVAGARALVMDAAGARKALAEAGSVDDRLRVQKQRTVRLIEAAEMVRDAEGKKHGPEAALIVARAELELDRSQDAKKRLEPFASHASNHLGLASALAVASLDGTICPGAIGGAANEFLCAAAWERDARVKPAVALLEKAWASGAGRDETGVEAYIGVVHVVPWIYGAMLGTGDPTQAAQRFRARLTDISHAAKEGIAVAPSFEGVKLFVDTLAAAFDAAQAKGEGKRVALPEKTQKDLVDRATALAKQLPDHRHTHAGVIAVAAMLAQERDVLPLVQALPQEIWPTNRTPRDVLRLWAAIAKRDAKLGAGAIGAIAEALPDGDQHPLERAKLVLLLAEGDLGVDGSERAANVLGRVASQLVSPGTPTELRLRAAMDVSGNLVKQNAAEKAAGMLEAVLTTSPINPGSATEKDLAFAAATSLFALRARLAKGDERVEYRDKLKALGEQPEASNVPASLRMVQRLWLREVDYLIEEERCGALKVCLARAQKKRSTTDKELEEAVGAESAKVLRAGVIPAGTLNLSFNFSGGGGLEPVVQLEPRLLATELPAWVVRR